MARFCRRRRDDRGSVRPTRSAGLRTFDLVGVGFFAEVPPLREAKQKASARFGRDDKFLLWWKKNRTLQKRRVRHLKTESENE
jgi:hypothetical protein